jgi:hypothetical protein
LWIQNWYPEKDENLQNEEPVLLIESLMPFPVKKKYATVWNQKLNIGEYSGISSLKLKNSGI